MIARRTPLRRSTERIERRARVRRVNPERRAENRDYSAAIARYLEEHPVCQIFIAELGLDEAEVVAAFRAGAREIRGNRIRRATQVHHRNKRDGDRLLDERWWMSACHEFHDQVESHKGWARELGYLLPIQANADGAWGAGNQALETPAFMASRIGR